MIALAGCSRSGKPEEIYATARANLERGDLVAALSLAEKGAAASKNQVLWAWRFRELQAEILVWQGKSTDALALIRDEDFPSELANEDVAVRRKLAQGMSSYYLQRFDESEKHLSDAERLAQLVSPALRSEVLVAQGALAILREDGAKAEQRLVEAAAIARKNHQRFVEANALGSLGVILMRRQHYDEAIDRFAASLAISETLQNRVQISKTLGNLGWCYFKMGDRERAFEAFTKSEQLAGELGLVRDQLYWLMNIGIVLNDQREYERAMESLKKALGIASKLENRSAVALSLSNMANTALAMGQFETAEKYNDEALHLQQAIGESDLYPRLNQARVAAGRKQYSDATKLLKEVIAKSGEDASLRWEAESELANILALQGNNTAAAAQFRTALKTIDKARASLKEEHRLSFMGSAERFYDDYMDFLVSRGRVEDALALSEHSRARTLAEGLNISIASLREAGFTPELAAKKSSAVVLSYWLKPRSSYLWAVTKTGVALFTLPDREQIEHEVQAYRKSLMGPRDVKEIANSSGTKLYDMLVAPARKLIPSGSRVIVVGDRGLNMLNFETLLVSRPQVHYLIEDAIISNASSIALLTQDSYTKGAREKKLLLIGDPVYSGSEFPELKQAKLELTEIAAHFGPDERTVLAGPAATPGAYVAGAPHAYAYVHFVAHGTASRTSPLDSSIILSRQSDTYKLYARDIMKQPLRAELVTISACYGAGNRSYSGEGLVGLSWAFLRAGAHSVIAALWEVSDASTPELMDSMYGGLKAGQDPATALREAKLKMLRSNGVYRRPFYWAAFQLYT